MVSQFTSAFFVLTDDLRTTREGHKTIDYTGMVPSRLFTDVRYVLTDDRATRERKTAGKVFLCCFGVDCVFIGWNGQLWRCNAFDKFWRLAEYYWVTNLKQPKLRLDVEERNARRVWRRTNGYRFECHVYDEHEDARASAALEFQSSEVHRAQLENVNHVLIRLQRWIKRALRVRWQKRARSALVMALHPRAIARGCALGGVGRDILEGVIMRLAFPVNGIKLDGVEMAI